MTRVSGKSKTPAVVGVSAGTGLSGLMMLLPDGTMKAILLLSCPALTVIIGALWKIFSDETDSFIGGLRLRVHKKQAQKLYNRLVADPTSTAAAIEEAKALVDTLSMLEVELRRKHINAIVAP